MSYGKIYSACRETSTRHPASLKTWGSRNIKLEKGNKRIETTLNNVASGVYTYKFLFDNISTNGKIIIVK
ncbi:MAG: hypothetical protein ORN55_01350 [Chitinophagaceae bacterium]|nr:hypothetical protein [Chitinophagaceae bacterium]